MKELSYAEIVARGKEVIEKKGLTPKYIGRGAETRYNGLTNENLFKLWGLRFGVLDPKPVSTDTELFGRPLKTPLWTGALSDMTDLISDPLIKIAQGTVKAGSAIWLGICSREQIKQCCDTGAAVVKIIKPFRDLDQVYQKLRAAEAAGCVAVGMDVDFFYGGKLDDEVIRAEVFGPKSADELQDLIASTKLPFILKGILSARDARRALELGARGIMVSNHGGLVIDYSAHPLEVLPEIKDAVGGKLAIFTDSGFRRGSDAFKALALGAQGVGFGLMIILGMLATGSDEGVAAILQILTEELGRVMAVTGCPDLGSISPEVLIRRGTHF